MKNQLHFEVVSHKDRDDLYAELWWGDEHWGEVRLGQGERELLVIHAPRSSKGYEFDLQDLSEMLARARRHLRSIEGIQD